jgi:NAD(P)-dependent dehydrogenase (short-subunit alcohol dehydrogenase family)
MGKLQDQVAIVTGVRQHFPGQSRTIQFTDRALLQGANGLGAGIVKKFVIEGAKVRNESSEVTHTHNSQSVCILQVIILDFNLKPLEGKTQPDSVKVVQGDVTSEASWKEALKVAVDTWGKLDIVCNNAGIVTGATVSNLLVSITAMQLLRLICHHFVANARNTNFYP